MSENRRGENKVVDSPYSKAEKDRKDNRAVVLGFLAIGVGLLSGGFVMRGYINPLEAVGGSLIVMGIIGLWETR